MPDAKRVSVFFDAQNAYKGARQTFFSPADPSRYGQFSPRGLAELLCSRVADGTLVGVHIYTGQPDGYLQRKGHAANARQQSAWRSAGVKVFSRPLRYSRNYPRDGSKPEEKGIDVAMALDIALLAGAEYDVGIVFSADTDLIPAIEKVLDGDSEAEISVAGWRDGRYGKRIWIGGRELWCHWVHRDDYERVRDDRDYNIA